MIEIIFRIKPNVGKKIGIEKCRIADELTTPESGFNFDAKHDEVSVET